MKRKSLLLLFVALLGFAGCSSSPPGDTAREIAASPMVQKVKGTGYLVLPDDPGGEGIVFYPGGLVQEKAYLPLLERFAEDGYTCLLLSVPFDLAVLASSKAERRHDIEGISVWHLAGHSLGGAMAATYLAKMRPDDIASLLLLGAYPPKGSDLSDLKIPVISIYGENDTVLTMENFEAGRSLLPPDTVYKVIPGGNHAMMGDYGPQKKDGEPEISPEEQWAQVVQIFEQSVKQQVTQ